VRESGKVDWVRGCLGWKAWRENEEHRTGTLHPVVVPPALQIHQRTEREEAEEDRGRVR
jgi:hypothetical protein